jgi:hypothetical protein
VRRLAIVFVVVLALVACGGSSKPKSHTSDAQAQIKSAYEKFFSGKTSVSGRVALLQNGSKFKGLVSTFASNPLAKNVSAKVSSVTLQGANKAKVVYVVSFAGNSLPQQTGSAVRESGIWKVADASLCKLVALQGSTPAICKS